MIDKKIIIRYIMYSSVSIVLLLNLVLFVQAENTGVRQTADQFYKRANYWKASELYEKIKDYPDLKDREKVLFNLAESYRKTGRTEESEITFNEIIENYASSTISMLSYQRLSSLMIMQKRIDDAIPLLKNGILRFRNDKLLLDNLILCYEIKKDFTSALKVLEEYSSAYKTDITYIEKKAMVLINLNRENDAFAYIQDIINRTGGRNVQFIALLAKIYGITRKHNQAAQQYQKAYNFSANAQYLIESGKSYAENKNISEALKVWKVYINKKKYSQGAYLQIGGLLEMYSDFGQVILLYNEGRQKLGQNTFFPEIISAFEITFKYREAVREYIKKYEFDGNFSYLKENLIRLSLEEARLDDVVLVLESAEKTNKGYLNKVLFYIFFEKEDYPKSLNYAFKETRDKLFILSAGKEMMFRKKYAEAEQILKKYGNLDKNTDDQVNLHLGVSLFMQNRYIEAESSFKKVGSGTYYVDARYYLASSYLKQGKYNNAIDELSRISKDKKARLKKIEIYIMLENYEQAKKEIKSLATPESMKLLGDIYFYTYENEKALIEYEKTAESFAGSDIANDALERIFIIQNFLSGDENLEKLRYYSRTEFLIFKSDYTGGIEMLIKLENNVQDNDFYSFIKYRKGYCYSQLGNYTNAISELKEVHKLSYFRAKALDLSAYILLFKLDNKTEALITYKELVSEYPYYPSIRTIRNRIEELRNLKVQ